MARRAAVEASSPALFAVDRAEPAPIVPARPGRHEKAVLAAIRASEQLAPRQYRAASTTLRALAAALDAAERKGDPYGVAQVAPRLHELMRDCGLLPPDVLGGDDADPFHDAGRAALVDDT